MQASYRLAMALVVAGTVLSVWIVLTMRGTQDGAEHRIAAGRPLVVGYAIEAPFAFLDDSGRVTGEAPEVLRDVLHDLQIGEPIWLHVEFGDLIHELLSRRIDVIAAGMYITPERSRKILFTRPTALVRGALLVRPEYAETYTSMAAIAHNNEARLAVLAGSVEYAAARALGMKPPKLLVFPDARSVAAAVMQKSADGASLSDVSLRYLQAQACCHGLVLIEAADSANMIDRPAFAFRFEDQALRDAIDAKLAAYLGSPRHRATVAPFGFLPEQPTP